MRFIFYSPVHFEKWDWRSSVETGIGGSETSHVELAWRLAQKGHEVITYAPIPDDCPGEWLRTTWQRLEDVNVDLDGTWLVYRSPEFMDQFPKTAYQTVFLICQDFFYQSLTPERLKKIDWVVPLCKSHGRYVIKKTPQCPDLKDKIWITSNGTKIELVKEIERENIVRNPYRIMHASSPDRGLLPLLKSFRKAKEFCPKLELHAFYGFNNIDKLIEKGATHLKRNKEEIMALAERIPDVHLHGRVSQPQLYREWFKSGIYCYETNFWETSHISGQEAQCMGAVPVFSPVWGQAENILHGIAIQGDADDPFTQTRFAAELARLAIDFKLQDKIRVPMMIESRARFDWNRMVGHLLAKVLDAEYFFNFPQQLEEQKESFDVARS